MGISCQSHDSIHLKILPTSLEVFSRDLFYFIRKAFNKAFDKLTNLQILNTILTLDSKETFLRILNFWSLNIQFNYFLSVMPQSYSEKLQKIQFVKKVNHSGFRLLSNVLHKSFFLQLGLTPCNAEQPLHSMELLKSGSTKN